MDPSSILLAHETHRQRVSQWEKESRHAIHRIDRPRSRLTLNRFLKVKLPNPGPTFRRGAVSPRRPAARAAR